MPDFSFKGADAERTIRQRCRGWRRLSHRSCGRGLRNGALVVDGFQKGCGWHKEKGTGRRAAEVEEPVVIARRLADEHVLDHLLCNAGSSAIPDKVGAELTGGSLPKGHVVPQYHELLSVLGDRGERVMRRRRLYRIVKFDVGQLGAA